MTRAVLLVAIVATATVLVVPRAPESSVRKDVLDILIAQATDEKHVRASSPIPPPIPATPWPMRSP